MAIRVSTGFDPGVHGFHFRNRWSGLDVVNALNVGVGGAAELASEGADFWEGWGLCGGMSWLALDRFYAEESVPAAADRPAPDSQLFIDLVDRQYDSFRGPALLARCLKWQSRAESGRWFDPRRTTWKLTLKQWPQVKALLDGGHPVSLALIRTETVPSDNHQVLAVGYCEDATGVAELDLYDPNHPDETPTIGFRLTGPEAGRGAQSTGERLRGFFVWPYTPPDVS